MHEAKDFLIAFPRIAKHFTNGERGKTLAQALDARNGEQMVVAVGRGTRTRQRPDQEETIIHNIEGFGFVAEVMFAARAGWLLSAFTCTPTPLRFGDHGARRRTCLRSVGSGSGLVGASVIDIGSLRIAPGCKATVIVTSRGIASTTFLPGPTCRTVASGRGLCTGRHLVAAEHVRTRRNQLAIGGKGNALFGRIPRKGAVGGDELALHQALHQTVLTGG